MIYFISSSQKNAKEFLKMLFFSRSPRVIGQFFQQEKTAPKSGQLFYLQKGKK